MAVHLVGGALDSTSDALLAPFLEEARARGRRLVVVLVERDDSTSRFLPDYEKRLGEGMEVVAVTIDDARPVDPSVFADADGIVVGGGPTPTYHAGLVGAAESIRAAVARGVPYLGFSAGAMIAPDQALLGGHLIADLEVVHEDCSEGLGPVTIRPGLGLARFTVDVHAAQAGTLSRAVGMVDAGLVSEAVAIDEDTCVVVGDRIEVSGTGTAWFITPSAYGVGVTRRSV